MAKMRKGKASSRSAKRDRTWSSAPAVIAGQRAQGHADHHRDAHRQKAHRQRDASAKDDAGQQIAALIIGAQRVGRVALLLPGRWQQAHAQVALGGIVGGDLGGKDGSQDIDAG